MDAPAVLGRGGPILFLDGARMRNALKFGAMLLAGLAMIGCQPQQPQTKQATASRSALDVRPVRTVRSAYANPQIVTPPDEPVAPAMVAPAMTTTPDTSIAASHRVGAHSGVDDGGQYKVKKGDTLYRIAKNRYGDGKKWTEIASANPGLTPRSLKVGQTIVIP